MTTEAKPSFNIVESSRDQAEKHFDDFKEDYLKGVPLGELKKKYGVTRSCWLDWKERLPIRAMPQGRPKLPRKSKKYLGDYWIQESVLHNFTVYRRIGEKRYSYGTYPSKKVADMVAEELSAYDWDKNLAHDLLHTYAIPNSRKTLSSRILRREF